MLTIAIMYSLKVSIINYITNYWGGGGRVMYNNNNVEMW